MNNSPQSMALWQQLLAAVKGTAPVRFVKSARNALLPENISDVVTGPAYALRPDRPMQMVDSARLLFDAMQGASQDQFEKMYSAPSKTEAVGHGLAGAIPMLGPGAAYSGEQMASGDVAGGLGTAAALLIPSLYRGGKAGAKWTGEAVDEVMAPRRAAAEALANKIKQAREWEAFNKANPNAAANTGKPSPYASGQGQGSMAQLPGDPTGIGGSPLFDGLGRSTVVNWGDEAVAPAPAASALPSRRDALKAGGAAGIGAMLAPKLMETPKTPVPLVEAAPVLGRSAPSALAREGLYRETKNRAVGYADPYVITQPKELPALNRDFNPETGKPYPGMSFKSGMINPERAHDRFFLSRVEGVGAGGEPVVAKQVFRMGREENLREALKAYTKNVTDYEIVPGKLGKINRVVHSEVTPEAALRLNTIEKRKLPLFTVDRRGRALNEGLDVPVDEMASSGMDFYLNDGAATGKSHAAVYATPKGKAPTKFIKEKLLVGDARQIDPSKAASIVDLTGKHRSSIPLSRPDTVGISPRYTKRVSIRLLKDTMAEQIKENKRAAGLKPPPLLAKAPVLQDNLKLSRFDFLRGIDLKKKP